MRASEDSGPKKRTRTGCLPCRTRRRKCDGARPRCLNCETRGSTCQWGLKASFHRSRNFSLSREEAAALVAIEKLRDRSTSHHTGYPSIIDETEGINRSYGTLEEALFYAPPSDTSRYGDKTGKAEEEESGDDSVVAFTLRERDSEPDPDSNAGDSDGSYNHQQGSPRPQDQGSSERLPASGLRIEDLLLESGPPTIERSIGPWFADFAFSPLSESTRSHPLSGSTALGLEDTYVPPFSLGQAISKDVRLPREPSLLVSSAEKIRLISSYMRETGTWCETTDSEMQFTMLSIHRMMNSTAFASAAMSLASRQLDHIEGRERAVTLELYQYTVQLLLCQDSAKADESLLATCTLLCVYEMMASNVSEWRRHLQGCAGLLRVKKWNGSSRGIVKSCFWAFARIDVWAAFNSGKTTLIPTDFWLDDMSIESVAAKGNVDDYCNLAILIFAQIVNVLADSHDENSRSMRIDSMSKLWDELQKWYRCRPEEVCPLLRDFPQSRAFPTVILSRSSSICGNTFYHAGSILLLQMGHLPPVAESPSIGNARSAIWHARELGGISMSNTSHANWVNQLQPLYLAGKAFASTSTAPGVSPESEHGVRFAPAPTPGNPGSSGGPELTGGGLEEEYPAEKIKLLKQLARIERETGWKTSDRAAKLRMLWGF